ncbi:MAG: hypothetical protein WAL11_18530, partial [Pseudolabrys sp.]
MANSATVEILTPASVFALRRPEYGKGNQSSGKHGGSHVRCFCLLWAVFAQAARSTSIMKSRVIGTASRLVESSN